MTEALIQGLQAMGMDAEKTAAASVQEIAAALKAADKSRPAVKQYAAVEVEEARKVLRCITDLADEHKPNVEKVPTAWMVRWDLVARQHARRAIPPGCAREPGGKTSAASPRAGAFRALTRRTYPIYADVRPNGDVITPRQGVGPGKGEHYAPADAVTHDHQELKRQYQRLWEAARDGQCDEWELEGPQFVLALIIILDQFSRLFLPANDGSRYEGDFAAQTFAQCLVESGADRELSSIERLFAYLPLLHAEHIGMQEAAQQLFTLLGQESPKFFGGRFASMAAVAASNIATLQEFGRFPQRNEAMMRKSTPQELAFIKAKEVGPPGWTSDT